MEENKEVKGSDINKTKHTSHAKNEKRQTIAEFFRFAVVVIAIVTFVRVFIAQPFIVSGASMDPTFQNSNYLIIDEITYRFEEPKRGDVIVFHPPIDMSVFYIKRIIGLPGEKVNVHNGKVTITNAEHPDGMVLDEPYITPDTITENVTMDIPEGNYFVMGDNRPASFDSRKWGILPKKNISGRVLIRAFPFNEFGIIPGRAKY